MEWIGIKTEQYEFTARLETAAAPLTCRWFTSLLPWTVNVIHVRWSGAGFWVPLGESPLPFGYENHTSHPSIGEVIVYPGDLSEKELVIPYGGVSFASKVGPLCGNHFLTIEEGRENLPAVGERVLWHGAQEVRFYKIRDRQV